MMSEAAVSNLIASTPCALRADKTASPLNNEMSRSAACPPIATATLPKDLAD